MVTTEVSVSSLLMDADRLRSRLGELEVAQLSGADCVRVAESMARLEKACSALRAMAAARAAAAGAHQGRGFTHSEDWAASLTGSTRKEARRELQTGARLDDCPQTRDAALAGDLSLGQADEIARTEKERPGSEGDLIALAASSSRQELGDECRRRRQERQTDKEISEGQHKARSMRSWTDGDGMVCGTFRLEPVVGVPVVERLRHETARKARAAYRAGVPEPWEAHAADALADLVMGAGDADDDPSEVDEADGGNVVVDAEPAAATRGKRRRRRKQSERTRRRAGPKTDLVVVVDLRTFRSGEHDDTVCHLIGGGPVDPRIVREMANDAFLKVVFHDAVDIKAVTHVGRYVPAELMTALRLGAAPRFEGPRCSGCGKRFLLERDHVVPIVAGGVTCFENLDFKCPGCHQEKTDAERAAGLYRAHEGSARTPTDP